MTPLEKLSVFILTETKKFTHKQIADFIGCTIEDVAIYSRPSPYRFGSYFRSREIRILKTIVGDEIANVKVAQTLTDDIVRLGHLAKVTKELKKLESKLSHKLMVFSLSDLTATEDCYDLKH